jgi:hypothetical protein
MAQVETPERHHAKWQQLARVTRVTVLIATSRRLDMQTASDGT